jgi:hypothetical protein
LAGKKFTFLLQVFGATAQRKNGLANGRKQQHRADWLLPDREEEKDSVGGWEGNKQVKDIFERWRTVQGSMTCICIFHRCWCWSVRRSAGNKINQMQRR